MSYKATKADVAEQIERPGPMPCRTCKTSTDLKTLCDHGGMCFSCYSSWRRAPLPQWPDIGDKAKNGTKDWAGALRRRDMAGERLTPFQRQAWRAALRGVEAGNDQS